MFVVLSNPRVKMYAKMHKISLEDARAIVQQEEDTEEKLEDKKNKKDFQDKTQDIEKFLDYSANYNMAFIEKKHHNQ